MIEIEDLLAELLSERSQVDGHDAGAGEFNIFVITDDPEATFKEVSTILGSTEFWDDVRIAYRRADASEYSILRPKHLTDFKVT